MNDAATRHQRRSLRLPGYDYAQAGAYFVTICTQQRICLFGKIVDGEMQLNEAGKMIHAVWHQLPTRFNTLVLDEFVVMPNHIHGILVLQAGDSKTGDYKDHPDAVQNTNRRGESRIRPHAAGNTNDGGDHAGGDHKDRPYAAPVTTRRGESCIRPESRIRPHPTMPTRPHGTLPDTVGRMLQAFKSITTHAYITGVKQHGWLPFAGKLWQRNYWEHVVRNEADGEQIREYICNNPAKWALDQLNPQGV